MGSRSSPTEMNGTTATQCLSKKILWSMVSNTAERMGRINRETLPSLPRRVMNQAFSMFYQA